MKLATRMWLLGAAVPALGMLLGLIVAGGWFRHHLEAAVDRALLAQAAVESVSLFDGPEGGVHLHMASSPLVESVRLFAPTGDLFGPDGKLVMSYPPRLSEEPPSTEVVPPGVVGQPPRLLTQRGVDGARFRVLLVTVAAPRGGLYTLRLSASLAQLDGSAKAFHRTTLSLALLFGVLLFLLQAVQAQKLKARLRRQREHIAALREGLLDHTLADDPSRDEIGELNQVLRETTAKLRAARAGQERFLADAAHELRTPLGLMRTSLDLALRRPRPVEELRTTIEEVRQEVVRLGALCQRLLDRSMMAQAEWDRSPVRLLRLAEEAVQAARAEAETRGVLIEIRSDDPNASVSGHAPALRQALDNLLSNALRYAPRGSTIFVEIEHASSAIRLAVRDEGPGVPASLREHIFSPFRCDRPLSTSKSDGYGQGHGHGLGLNITQEIATRHAGRLFIDDQRRPGARFVIEFPTG